MLIAPTRPRSRARGFTLIEVSIALAVLAILAALAWPSFAGALQRSRRSEATAALLQLQLAQERWRSGHPAYANDLAALGLDAAASPHYRLTLAAGSAQGYRAVATAVGPQAADAGCTSFVLSLDAGRVVLGSTGSATADACWRSS